MAEALLTGSRASGDNFYLVLGFGPGVVRYLHLRNLRPRNIKRLHFEAEPLLATAKISILDWGGGSLGKYFEIVDSSNSRDRSYHHYGFSLGHVARWDTDLDAICQSMEMLRKALRVKHFPTAAYWTFHSVLHLTTVNLTQFLKAWRDDAFEDIYVYKTLSESSDHIVVPPRYSLRAPRVSKSQTDRLDLGQILSRLVFQRTEFVRHAEDALRESAEAIKAAKLQSDLVKSKFTTFTYLVEDLDNGLMKIGKSKTPGVREKTLQSEKPNLKLRIAVPAADTAERTLHIRFSHRRKRGEWFELSATNCLQIVTYLLQNGDASRATVDQTWLGGVTLRAVQEGAISSDDGTSSALESHG